MKKMNNKGFSLVELIVVIAIMAVLIGVLAPQFLRYVEKSRLQKDNQSVSEIASAAKAAMANEKIYDAVGTGTSITPTSCTYTFTKAGTTASFVNELADTVGTQVICTSKTYKTAGNAPTLSVAVDGSTKTVKVTATNYYADVAGPAETKTF